MRSPASPPLLAVVALTFLAQACRRTDDVGVSVTYRAAPTAPAVEGLTVIVGGSKSAWPRLEAGASRSVLLSPEGEPPSVTVLFSLGGRRIVWEGPLLQHGLGHSVGIEIEADGRVVERHCARPCSLPGS